MVNEAAARYLRGLTGRDVVGQRLSSEGADGPFFEVVGVAADSRLAGPRQEAFPFVYLFHPQVATLGATGSMTLLVRTAGDPLQWLDELRAAVASIDPNLPLVDAGTLAGHLSGLLAQERLTTTLLGLSALLALALAAIGLYGVIAYAVSQRTRELGLRMALGARRGDLLALVLRRGMALALAGLAVGLAAAFGGTRVLEGFLYGTSRTDPFTFVLVSGLLLAVALVASYLPARAATRVDPLRALRHE